MKVKQIVGEGPELMPQKQPAPGGPTTPPTPGAPTTSGQPQTGKVSAVDSATGEVTVTQANGVVTKYPAGMITQTTDGKFSVNNNASAQPGSTTASQPNPLTPGKDISIGMSETPNEDQLHTPATATPMTPPNSKNIFFVNYAQMAANVGNGLVKIDVSKNWDTLTPDVIAQNQKDYWDLIYLNVNNQMIPALKGRLGGNNVIKVGKTDYTKIQAAGQGATQSPMITKESSELTAMLKIAGLR